MFLRAILSLTGSFNASIILISFSSNINSSLIYAYETGFEYEKEMFGDESFNTLEDYIFNDIKLSSFLLWYCFFSNAL
jgi:hypothetical protein